MVGNAKTVRCWVVIVSVITSCFLVAGCDSGEQNRCKTGLVDFMANISLDILERTGNIGEDVRSEAKSCKYTAKDQTLFVEMSISWKGPLTGDFYKMSGTLQDTPYMWEWQPTKMNGNLQGWNLFNGYKNSELIVKEIKYKKVILKNNCVEPISVAIDYKPVVGERVTQGWYNIDPFTSIDTGKTTSNTIIYFYAKSGAGEDEGVWAGKLSEGGVKREISTKPFSYKENEKFKAEGLDTVIFVKRNVPLLRENNMYTMAFSCDN